MRSLRIAGMCAIAAALHAQAPQLPSAPGRLVDIGGRRLHILCSGSGSPTVVLEAGASAFAIDWTLVQREVEHSSRVCSYDRADMGWSDPAPRGSRASAWEDLHKLLAAAGERPPFVLVDPSTEDRLFTMVNGEALTIASVTPEQLRSTLPTNPVAIPRRRPQTGAPFDQLPAELYRIRVLLDERLIASLAALSTNSRHIVVHGAGHEIHLFAPAAVVQAIEDALQAVRGKTALPSRQDSPTKPYLPIGLFFGQIEEGARIFTPARLLPLEHPEALGHQFPTLLQLHGSEFPALLWLGNQAGLRLWATLQRYPTEPSPTWPYPDFSPPPDTTQLRAASVIHRPGVEAPLPGLRAVLYGDRHPILFIVDTRGLTLAARRMQTPTTMGLDLTRAQFLEALARAAGGVPEAGLSAVVFDR